MAAVISIYITPKGRSLLRKKLSYILYRIIKWLILLFYPKIEVVGTENIPAEPAIFVGNHCQMNGPIIAELYFPVKRRTWCAGQMMHIADVPEYAFQDFWSQKPRFWQPFYRLLSYIIAPLSVCIFNNADTIVFTTIPGSFPPSSRS